MSRRITAGVLKGYRQGLISASKKHRSFFSGNVFGKKLEQILKSINNLPSVRHLKIFEQTSCKTLNFTKNTVKHPLCHGTSFFFSGMSSKNVTQFESAAECL